MEENNSNNIMGAITYPSRSEENVQSVPVQPRQPRNLQGLLMFAMEATKAEDAPGNSELGPMDEERRKFLEEALKSLTVDTIEVLQNSIKTLTNIEKMHGIKSNVPLPEDVKNAFTSILDLVDDIDAANDFHKLGGFAIFPICFGSENAEVRALASTVLAELCQNNPYCQSRALECGLLSILLSLLQTETGRALAKCLYAVSCCSREFEPACRQLTSQGGCEMLLHVLQTGDEFSRVKAAFFIQYLCRHHVDAKEKFIQHNLVKVIADQINCSRDQVTEHLLSTLLALLEGENPTVLEQCRDLSINLKRILEEHLKHPDLESDRFCEEIAYCKELLKIFSGTPQAEPVDDLIADR